HGSVHGVHEATVAWSAQPDSGVHAPVAGSTAYQVSPQERAAQWAATQDSPLPHSLETSQGFPLQPAKRISKVMSRFIGGLRRRLAVQRLCLRQVPDLVGAPSGAPRKFEAGAVNFPDPHRIMKTGGPIPMKLPFMDTLGSVGLVGERKAMALLCLGFYTTLFFMIGLSARTELPEWVPVFSAMTLMYALAFFSVAAEWFWGRWFATGLGYW